MRKIHVKYLKQPRAHIKCLFKHWQLYFLILLFCNPFRKVSFFLTYLENKSSSWVPNLSPLSHPSPSNLPILPSWYVGRTPVAPTYIRPSGLSYLLVCSTSTRLLRGGVINLTFLVVKQTGKDLVTCLRSLCQVVGVGICIPNSGSSDKACISAELKTRHVITTRLPVSSCQAIMATLGSPVGFQPRSEHLGQTFLHFSTLFFAIALVRKWNYFFKKK